MSKVRYARTLVREALAVILDTSPEDPEVSARYARFLLREALETLTALSKAEKAT